MNQQICDYVSPRTEPDFFDHPDDTLKEIQGEIKKGIETASEVMTITVDQELKERAEKKLSGIGWTLEEAFILYLYWCITCPSSVDAWLQKAGNGENKSCSTSQETPTENSAALSDSANG
ncbi:MAG: hypothetical protein Q4E45_07215 [Eubacteriales bacterium]|nr:hypothetical protein [Eubacteriales bacterium]